MFKSNKKATKIKENLEAQLRSKPENNYLLLREKFIKVSRGDSKSDINDHIDALKMAIKAKGKAEPKFYYLLLLRDMLLQKQGQPLPNPHVLTYFQKKIAERLFKITYNKGHQVTEKYKEECLSSYLQKQ